MESHWGRLFRKGVLAITFAGAVCLSGLLYSLFWVVPEGDEGKQWLVHWRPLLLRNAWTQTPEITPQTLLAWQGQGLSVWLVDVRSDEEQRVSMISGAMTRAEYAARRASEQPDRVVAYCTLGIRSGQWVDQHQSTDVPAFNLSGELSAGRMWLGHSSSRVDNGAVTRVHRRAEYTFRVSFGI